MGHAPALCICIVGIQCDSSTLSNYNLPIIFAIYQSMGYSLELACRVVATRYRWETQFIFHGSQPRASDAAEKNHFILYVRIRIAIYELPAAISHVRCTVPEREYMQPATNHFIILYYFITALICKNMRTCKHADLSE